MMHRRQIPLQVREATQHDDGSATITGVGVPWGQTIDYRGQAESFARGAISPDDAVGVPLLWGHSEPIGHITEARDTEQGLEVVAQIVPTTLGRDAALLVRSGSVSGLSVGFQPVTMTQEQGGAVRYDSASLHELSLVANPAYPDARVSDVRADESTTTTTLEGTETMTEELDQRVSALADELDHRMAAVTDRIQQVDARVPAQTQPVLSVREGFGMLLADLAETGQYRALADVVSSANTGLLPPTWADDVVNYLDTRRPVMNAAGSMAYPATGTTFTQPKVTQDTTVAARGTEATEPPTQALTTSTTTYSTSFLAGSVGIGVETLETSSPSAMQLVTENLLDQYAIASESAFVTAAEAAGTHLGNALTTTDWGTIVADIVAASLDVYTATNAPGDLLALTTASWEALLTATDGDNRRVLAPNGPTNADGAALITSQSVNVAGVQAFHSPQSSVDMLFNTRSLRVMEKPPMQLRQVNVGNLTEQVGVIGGIIPLPLVPTGIITFEA